VAFLLGLGTRFLVKYMTRCNAHTDFFDDLCSDCKKEYNEMKGIPDKTDAVIRESARFPAKYKEFTEERAKQLYHELFIQYLKSTSNEMESAQKARRIIRKQCSIRGMPYWSWI
jgi:hypothetical protein